MEKQLPRFPPVENEKAFKKKSGQIDLLGEGLLELEGAKFIRKDLS